jgi:molybdopterin-guanine dinucleotide biosynthesis protein A
MTDLTVAIIAGGKSSRMGTDKSFVEILGKPLIEHILERINDLGQQETILITNRPDDYSYLAVPMYNDILPEKGSLGGIYTAIHQSKNAGTLVVACDMPFINVDLFRYMIGLFEIEDTDIVVPRVEGYPQGLHAMYSKNCLAPIRERLDADRLKVIGFYDDVRVRYVDEPEYEQFDPQGWSFYNVNTPDELREAREMASKAVNL